MSRAKYAVRVGRSWLYVFVWAGALYWVLSTDYSTWVRVPVALALFVGRPSLSPLFTSYSAYLSEYRQSTAAIRTIELPGGPYDRPTSLRLLADALEMVLATSFAEHADVILEKLPRDLHPDVKQVLGLNVGHFLADFDIRRRDDDYRRKQELDMRNLIRDLRNGDPLEVLMEHDFL